MKTQNQTNSGIGWTLLTILFIGLKLCHVIDWSWWWVLAPMWVPLCICLVLAVIYGVVKGLQK